MRRSLRLAAGSTAVLAMLLLANLPLASTAFAESDTVVAKTAVQVRAAPSVSAPVVGQVAAGDSISTVGSVPGDEVLAGNVVWFELASGGFVYSGYTAPSAPPPGVNISGTGRYIEIDRANQVAYAIENGAIVHTALVTVGVPAFPTPVGTFQILRRVLNETMDSRTIGIPLSSPLGYYLPDVLYTQYITGDGVALHFNYWSPPGAFGNYPGSHGCIGLMLADAEFFWNFADIGTTVIITA